MYFIHISVCLFSVALRGSSDKDRFKLYNTPLRVAKTLPLRCVLAPIHLSDSTPHSVLYSE